MCGLCFELLLLVLSICFASLVSLVEIFLLLDYVLENAVIPIAWFCFGYTLLALVILLEILIDVLDYVFLALENAGPFSRSRAQLLRLRHRGGKFCGGRARVRTRAGAPDRTGRTPGGPLLSV